MCALHSVFLGGDQVPIAYADIVHAIPSAFQDAMRTGLPWSILLRQRSHTRLRCGLVELGHLRGRRTKAKKQNCIFCGHGVAVELLWLHVFCGCTIWSRQTADISARLGVSAPDMLLCILLATPDSDNYPMCVSFMDEIVQASNNFWTAQAPS